MGFIQPKRIQVKLLKPDLALALTWWSVAFPSSNQMVVGNTTMNLRKFDDGSCCGDRRAVPGVDNGWRSARKSGGTFGLY
jgi:hypothetical protein